MLKIKEASVKEANALMRAQRRVIMASNALNDYMARGHHDDTTLGKLEDAVESAVSAFRGLICKQIISIPADWLVEDAPSGLDWSKGDSLDWLRQSKLQVVIDHALGRIEETTDTAKN
jgi:hypothetical protein